MFFEQIHSTCSELVSHVTGTQAVKCCLILCEHMLSVGFSGIPFAFGLYKPLVPVQPRTIRAENFIGISQG